MPTKNLCLTNVCVALTDDGLAQTIFIQPDMKCHHRVSLSETINKKNP